MPKNGPSFHILALDLLDFSSENIERVLSMLCSVDWNEYTAVTDTDIDKYASIYYCKL